MCKGVCVCVWVCICPCPVLCASLLYISLSLVDADDCEDDSISEERVCQSLTNSPSRGRGVVLRQKSDIGDRIPRTTSVRRRSASFKKVQKYKRQEAREEKVLSFSLASLIPYSCFLFPL